MARVVFSYPSAIPYVDSYLWRLRQAVGNELPAAVATVELVRPLAG